MKEVISYVNSRGVKYYLHSVEVLLKSGYKHTAYYFSLSMMTNDSKAERTVSEYPIGYEIVEGKHGLPFLRKSK